MSENKTLSKQDQNIIQMSRDVQKNILEPIMNFSRLVVDDPHGFEPKEICAMLRLLVMGGYADLKGYGVTSGGGYLDHMPVDYMDTIDKEWNEAIQTLEGTV